MRGAISMKLDMCVEYITNYLLTKEKVISGKTVPVTRILIF